MNADLGKVLLFFKALGFSEVVCSPKGAFTITTDTNVVDIGPKDALRSLAKSLEGCTLCKLHSTRTNIVFGEGSPEAALMFVGEGPGADEDIQGRPFVGKAGQLLTNLINKLGLSREEVYIANIVKCRPPNNRDPEEDERSACISYLREQIDIIRPKAIIALGKIATHSLMGSNEPIGRFSIMKMRGKFFNYQHKGLSIPVMPTYHPSYLLRNPQAKWDVWNDAQQVMRLLRGEANQ